jgi:signal transduction histidine kinase
MSHELRTPLNAISGYARPARDGDPRPVTDAQRHALERIQLSQRHLLGLINEVLNYARLETGTVRYDIDRRRRATRWSPRSRSSRRRRARGPRASSLPSARPASPCAPTPRSCGRSCQPALERREVHRAGGRIEMSAHTGDDRVQIAVVRHGHRHPRGQARRSIFDPFVQVRADLTRPHEGAGLGLAISRDLARGMGGDLTAESTQGMGSTFYFFFADAVLELLRGIRADGAGIPLIGLDVMGVCASVSAT